VLVYLALSNVIVGLWATVAPRSWYDDFPGLGRSWVAPDGPYNEHLVRDVGAWSLAMLVLCAAAAWTMRRDLVLVAGIAATVQSVPHLVYHLRHTDPFDGLDLVGSIGGIGAAAALGAAVAVWAWRSPQPAA
jgi:hypothetical protein